jgi:uncharacterized protein (DUF1684 family)
MILQVSTSVRRFVPSPFSVFAVVMLLAAVLSSSCSSDRASYPDSIAAARAEKDRMLRESPDSPVPAAARAAFPPLEYFPPDERYRVPASLAAPKDPDETIVMPTSTGQRREMRRAGTLLFNVRGQPLQLSAFYDVQSPVPNRLFVPFKDLTSGKETYPGGRYLDLDPNRSGIYVIDFNYAYSPYCAYNPEYDCPFPPPENRLGAEIRAGEKHRNGEKAEGTRPKA